MGYLGGAGGGHGAAVAWRRPGERDRWWRGLGLEDGYEGRGEREALSGSWGEEEVAMGRRWRAWRRPREQGRLWRMLGVQDVYWRPGEREALWGSLGEGEVDMGQQWRVWRRPGERERRERERPE